MGWQEIPKNLSGNFISEVDSKIVAIVLIENLGSTALTLDVFDEHKKPTKGIIYLDLDWVNVKLN
jgi:hypothetical protein